MFDFLLKIDSRLKKNFNKCEYHREISDYFIYMFKKRLINPNGGPEIVSSKLNELLLKAKRSTVGGDERKQSDYDEQTGVAEENNLSYQDATFFGKFFLVLSMSQMDIYLLFRMFKKFTIKDPDIDHQPEYSNVNIIYTGGAHTGVYKDFFNYMEYRGHNVDLIYDRVDQYVVPGETKRERRCLTIDRKFIRRNVDILI